MTKKWVRSAVLFLGCALPLVAGAQEGAAHKRWMDATCNVSLETAPRDGIPGFNVAALRGAYRNYCRLGNWPLDRAEADLICEDKTAPTLAFEGTDAVLNGLDLLASGEKRITLLAAGDPRLNCQ